jgi:hypothetical protein
MHANEESAPRKERGQLTYTPLPMQHVTLTRPATEERVKFMRKRMTKIRRKVGVKKSWLSRHDVIADEKGLTLFDPRLD